MKRATLVVTMTLLLGSASVAAAECAWVLWEENALRDVELPLVQPERTHTIISVHSTHQECEEQRKVVIPKWEKEWQIHKERVDKTPEMGAVFSARLLCLPDTIDPRERKE